MYCPEYEYFRIDFQGCYDLTCPISVPLCNYYTKTSNYDKVTLTSVLIISLHVLTLDPEWANTKPYSNKALGMLTWILWCVLLLLWRTWIGAIPMVTMAQSAANWRNTHTRTDRTYLLTHLHQQSYNHVVCMFQTTSQIYNNQYLLIIFSMFEAKYFKEMNVY